jgi:hypothetical protein
MSVETNDANFNVARMPAAAGKSVGAPAATRPMRQTQLQSAAAPSGGSKFASFQAADSFDSSDRSQKDLQTICRF